MIIWIDADACPRPAKEIVFKAGKRLGIKVKLVANQWMRIPNSPLIELVVVESGLDVADDAIAEAVAKDDLVITADIPLAARIVDRGARGIDPRGLVYSAENVKEKLATRNLLAELREVGMMGTGPPPYKPKDRSKFASALDRLLTKLLKDSAAGEVPG